jgi:hypothetical protein
MRVFLTLWRRELSASFASPVGYVVLAAVLFLLGVSFTIIVDDLSRPSDIPLTELFHASLFFWVILLLSTPIITMRTFAAERATGTYENLMTTPVGDAEVVFGKFAGALSFFAILWFRCCPACCWSGITPTTLPRSTGVRWPARTWASCPWARSTRPWACSPRPSPATRSSPRSWRWRSGSACSC